MNKKKIKLPLDVLIKHLNTYKDAVVILGPDILGETKQFEISEETYEKYNRKKMVKEPNEFWNYYIDNIMKPLVVSNKITQQLNNLLKMNLHSTIIDTNYVKTIQNSDIRRDLISPNGKNNRLECVKCHKIYEADSMIRELGTTESVVKCECGGKIKPTVLYHGERYSQPLYKSIKNSIFTEEKGAPTLNTHTLIFIGVDFTDSLISEIIDSYDALKDNDHYTVIITDKLNRDDLIYYNPEFGVADSLDLAINRLINLLK
jgi:hypothetical protein